MLDKQRVFANFVITADTKTEETTTPERHYIYSRLNLATNAMGFLQIFFLTTRSTFTTFYDDKSAYVYDVESSMLTFEEAKHFSQFLLSRYVNIVEIGGALAPITIDYGNNIFDDPFHRTFD